MRDATSVNDDVFRSYAKKVAAGKPDECWPWRASLTGVGYGQLVVRQCHYAAHRVAYTLAHGAIPQGAFVLHSCDNRCCCNPAHLRLGTAADNTHDMMMRGRRRGGPRSGEANHAAKLTRAQVDQIRARYTAGGVSQHQLSAEYAITQAHVWRIVHMQVWVTRA